MNNPNTKPEAVPASVPVDPAVAPTTEHESTDAEPPKS